MEEKMIPLKEKLEILTYLQSQITNSGSFLLTFLKTKNSYQLSFVNGLAVKVICKNVDDCLEGAIRKVSKIYHDEHKRSFWDDYNYHREQGRLKERNQELVNSLNILTEKYDKLLSKVYSVGEDDIVSDVMDDDIKEDKEIESTESEMSSGEPKKKRGRPVKNKVEKELKTIIKRKNRECKYTEKQLNKEMLRINPNMKEVMVSSDEWSNKKYQEERKKAYKRLNQKGSKKIAGWRENLKIKDNKYNITKCDILEDMQRVVKSDPEKMTNRVFEKEWTKAKSRVWNRRYNEEKNSRW
tara:strand:+ start:470 stop:1360 length:891 start_codon:yes stop_codon:yes gene_type:complete